MNTSSLTEGLLWYIVFLYSTTCHEAAHAWTALRLGDDTAQKGGQASLNPWPHLRREPIGMGLVPLITWVTGGWIMGWASAPYSRAWALAYPRRAALMAAAGPAANFTLLLLAAALLRLGLAGGQFEVPGEVGMNQIALGNDANLLGFAAHVLSIAFSLNLLLGVFNLIPIPPLDGSSLPLLVLPPAAAAAYMKALSQPMVRMIGILIIFKASGVWFRPLLLSCASLLTSGFSHP